MRNSTMAKEIMKVSISTKSQPQGGEPDAGDDSNKMFIELFSNANNGLNDSGQPSADRGNSRGDRRR